jgi:hypothetical protein
MNVDVREEKRKERGKKTSKEFKKARKLFLLARSK